jgi:O-antigen/teichoic acid export membrane protein
MGNFMAASNRWQSVLKIAAGKGSVSAVFQTFLTNILFQLLNIGTGLITARLLAPQGRGELASVIMWPQFLGGLLSMGIPTALIYQMRLGTAHFDEFVGTAIVLGTVNGALAAIIGVIGLPYMLHGYPPDIVYFARWAVLTAPFVTLSVILVTTAQATQNFGRFNKLRLLPGIITLIALLTLVALKVLTPQTAAVTYLFAGLPVLIWNGLWVKRTFHLKFDNIPHYASILLGYGFRVWGVDLIGGIGDQVDRILVVAFLTPRDMGLYVVALSSARLFNIVPASFSSVMTPKIIMLGPKLGAPLLVRTARIAFTAMLSLAIPLGIFSRFALTLVYGHKFGAAVPIFRVLVAEAVLAGFTWLLAQGFSSLGKPGRATIQQMVGLSASVPLLLILVPRFGVDGACFALLGSTTLRTIFAIASYKLLFGEKLIHFIPRFSDVGWISTQLRAKRATGGSTRATE